MSRSKPKVKYLSTDGCVPPFYEPGPGKPAESEEGVLHLKSEQESRVMVLLASVNLAPAPRH